MGLEDDIAKLARIPAFAVLEPEALRLIAFSAETRILRAGDILFRKEEVSNGGLAVLTGSIALDASDLGSGTARIVRAPGLIGETALLTQTVRPATAIAREPASVLRISRQLFHRVLAEFPASAQALRQSLGARLRQFTGELAALRQNSLASAANDAPEGQKSK
jgi:CRP-like cAMP-binding protein